MTYFMLRSPAWRSLSGASIKVFLELHTRFHGLNNGDMFLSLDEAAVVENQPFNRNPL
jgi:hypothetical protein